MKVENELPSAESAEMSLVGYGAFDHRNMNFPSNCKIRENIANFTITFRWEIYQE